MYLQASLVSLQLNVPNDVVVDAIEHRAMEHFIAETVSGPQV